VGVQLGAFRRRQSGLAAHPKGLGWWPYAWGIGSVGRCRQVPNDPLQPHGRPVTVATPAAVPQVRQATPNFRAPAEPQQIRQAFANKQSRWHPHCWIFYADWCIALQGDGTQRSARRGCFKPAPYSLDTALHMTANTPQQQALLGRARPVGPPGSCFTQWWSENRHQRILGEMNRGEFLQAPKRRGYSRKPS